MKKDFRFLKVGNESIDKQEWSMFNGLRKKAESEIGNETYQHKLYPDKYVIINGKNYKIITDGKVEKSGELTDAVLYGINQTYKRVSSMNSKTGNKAIVLKDGNVWVVLYANETKSQEFESEAEAREFAKKVGNANPEEMEVKYKGYTITYFPYQKKYMVRHPNEVSGLVQKHFTSVDEAKKAIDKKAIGNEETDLIKRGFVYKVIIPGKKPIYFNNPKQAQISADANKGTVEKVGNAQYGSKEDIISHLDTDLYEIHQRLKQKDENPWRYLSELQKKGYDMGTLSRHNKDIGKIIEKLKTGNANVDWSKVTDKYIDKNGHEVVIQKKEDGYYITNLRNGKEIFAPDRYSAIGIMEKNGSRVENEETKAERKFGKVMGEFEEGALKTPQGKTVTDPAQAKAIAYSEADKVDNLKRARNAMNKKTGNKKYHVWTDSGNWDMVVSEEELENLKTTYKNFHYEEVK